MLSKARFQLSDKGVDAVATLLLGVNLDLAPRSFARNLIQLYFREAGFETQYHSAPSDPETDRTRLVGPWQETPSH